MPHTSRRPLTAATGCLLGVLLSGGLLLGTLAWAAGFKVLNASTRLEQGVYLLDARLVYRFNQGPLDALQNGVPLTIELELQVFRGREWLWDEAVARLRQRYRLEYHALSRQYVVANLNSGELNSFPDLAAATDFCGRIHDFPLLDASLLRAGASYYGRLRASLDLQALPVPLQAIAYLSADWWLVSEWHTWRL
jgi:hypothetical protein